MNTQEFDVVRVSGVYLVPRPTDSKMTLDPPSDQAVEALDEVNERRAQKRLPPFERDEALTQAAKNIAQQRAKALCSGHTRNDFAGLPEGAQAEAAGCAAWPQGQGWGSCCSDEHWKYAGAAYCIGRDSRRYMQLFVSNEPNS